MDDIVVKTISGFIILIVIMGIFIFLPAWTINYLQAWIYLLACFCCFNNINYYIFV